MTDLCHQCVDVSNIEKNTRKQINYKDKINSQLKFNRTKKKTCKGNIKQELLKEAINREHKSDKFNKY